MRLYSRVQVAGIVLVAIAITLAGNFLVDSFVMHPASNGTTAEVVSTENSIESEPAFILNENTPSPSIEVSDSVKGYTQDETQN
ncbi:MAG: hypothetical protein JW875_03020, partial [Spirochaetales bacterium]|nr:hypothetical protein [Spirochaetales bacterium]